VLLVVFATLLVCDLVLSALLELLELLLGALAPCVLVEESLDFVAESLDFVAESLDFVAESLDALLFCGLLAPPVEPLDAAAGAVFELVAGALFAVVAGALVCCVWPVCGVVAERALGKACGPKTIALAANSETRRCAQRRAGLEPRGWSGTAITRRAADLWRPSPCLVSIE